MKDCSNNRNQQSLGLYALLRDSCAVSEDTTAFTFLSDGNEPTSWKRAELFREAEQLGERLGKLWAEISGQANGLLGIFTSSQEQQVLCELAALSQGIVPAILTPYNHKLDKKVFLDGMAKVVQHVAPTLVVTDLDAELAEILQGTSKKFCSGIASLDMNELRVIEDAQTRSVPDNSAFVQFSSGTTGVKKAVSISLDAMKWQLDAYAKELGIGPSVEIKNQDVIVSWLPLYHDMGFITALHLPLYCGLHSVMINPLEWVARPASFIQASSEYRATLGWLPNFSFSFLARRVRDEEIAGCDISSLRHLVNCSEPVTQVAQDSFVERFRHIGFREQSLSGCYAMAETTFAVTHGVDTGSVCVDNEGLHDEQATGLRLPMVSVGKPLNGIRVEIRDANGDAREDRQLGEICIKAPCLANCYLDDDATRAAFVDGWYRSGDLGYVVNESLYVCGRSKDLIIASGHNVFPEDVEAIVGRHESIKDGRVCAFAHFDKRSQTEKVVVLAEPNVEEAQIDFDDVLLQLAAELNIEAARIELVPQNWLIKSSSGKISRSGSAKKWLEGRSK